MRLLKLLPLALLLLLPNLSRADIFSITDTLKTLPLKEGVMYDFKHQRTLNTLGLGLVHYDNVGLDLVWIGVDGLGATLDYSLQDLPVKNIPIVQYTQYLNIGYTVGYRTMTMASDTGGNPKSDNSFISGPTMFMKFKF